MSNRLMFGLMKGTACAKPSGALIRNSFRRFRAEDGKLYHQFFDETNTVYNTDGARWFRLSLHIPTVHSRYPSLRASNAKATGHE